MKHFFPIRSASRLKVFRETFLTHFQHKTTHSHLRGQNAEALNVTAGDLYTGCFRENLPYFRRTMLRLNNNHTTRHTDIRS